MEERSRDIVAEALERAGDAGSVGMDRRAVRMLERYVSELLRASRTMHIVGRTDVELNIVVQLADSLDMLRFAESFAPERDRGNAAHFEGAEPQRSVADIGSGAGFPGIVWKIVRPSLFVTLFERRERMAVLLGTIGAKLGLVGLAVVQDDANEYEPQGAFDVVVSKAAGSLGAVIPIAERLLRIGGRYCTIKGSRAWCRELRERGADRLTLERDEASRSAHGRLLCFSKKALPAARP
jgi:16S rRNA (guanine(527)-N(7))-methyltransferase RsmG